MSHHDLLIQELKDRLSLSVSNNQYALSMKYSMTLLYINNLSMVAHMFMNDFPLLKMIFKSERFTPTESLMMEVMNRRRLIDDIDRVKILQHLLTIALSQSVSLSADFLKDLKTALPPHVDHPYLHDVNNVRGIVMQTINAYKYVHDNSIPSLSNNTTQLMTMIKIVTDEIEFWERSYLMTLDY